MCNIRKTKNNSFSLSQTHTFNQCKAKEMKYFSKANPTRYFMKSMERCRITYIRKIILRFAILQGNQITFPFVSTNRTNTEYFNYEF